MSKMEEALDLATNGHSFVITGQCGTGKTHLLRQIITSLLPKKRIAVTATIGMASTQLGSGATTLHYWSGILDGRYSQEKLTELFNSDDKFASAKKRVMAAECLIIDEISMLSSKILEMVEFVCRSLRKNDSVFGGLQVIASGDFKQLPPVPNHVYGDDGNYCFESYIFGVAFPHHIKLQKVVRQHEPRLITAVNELCDGTPSDATISFLKSLDRPLTIPDDSKSVQLHGTNFDVSFINHELLEEIKGEEYVFRSKDEGNVRFLRKSNIPKTLVLKEGAPVILIKNIGTGLFNGIHGSVHKLTKDNPPIINFNGRLVPITPVRFDMFDAKQQKELVARTQLPIILAFALSVHRAQGKSLQYISVDCSSFFAPGQMGVAVGRAISSDGLQILNFNNTAATRRHPKQVYDFYDLPFQPALHDLKCCSKCLPLDKDSSSLSLSFYAPAAGPSSEQSEGDVQESSICDYETPPWDVTEFLQEHSGAVFLSDLSDGFFFSDSFKNHMKLLYHNVCEIVRTTRTKSPHWVKAYSDLNKFLTDDQHINYAKMLFGVDVLLKSQNKLSTKLVFWLMDKEIQQIADQIIEKQTRDAEGKGHKQELSSAGKSKLRYLAGACVQKITKRLKESVLRKLGKSDKTSKIKRRMDYKKQAIMKQFRISEADLSETDETMTEIKFKQGATRGLTVVNDQVFGFFVDLNSVVQQNLTNDHFNLFCDQIHKKCTGAVDDNSDLAEKWMSLFAECASTGDALDDDDVLLTLVMELYRDITEHFIRISLIDALKSFKRTVPKTKKQALRTKITALGERACPKAKKITTDSADIYSCNMCNLECEWEPEIIEYESIACDKCNCWYHYKCVDIKGTETFLTATNSTWFCSNCSKKGKGRGKGRGKAKAKT